MKLVLCVVCISIFLATFGKSSPLSHDKTLNYRLNTDVEPLDYIIDVTPYFDDSVIGKEPFTFDGVCIITIKARLSNVDAVTLHKQDLDIVEQSLTKKSLFNEKFIDETNGIVIKSSNYNEQTNKYTLNLASALVKDELYVLKFAYSAKLRTDLYGFYRSSYQEGNVTK